MTEEEKKAVEDMKQYVDDIKLAFNGKITTETAKNYKIILNLIDKLQKENEELKILKSGIQTLQDLRIEDGKYIVMSKNDFLNGSCKHLLDDYISRQKIKDEIKELDKRIKNPKKISYWASYTISECIGIRSILQELLEETEK